jgi:lipopolysaccharide transport system ATP-binding protein
MSDAIELQGVGKRYWIGGAAESSIRFSEMLVRLLSFQPSAPRESFNALTDVSFTIPAGQVVGIIGHNGAGKSTLLKLLSRITAPSTGKITLRGRTASLLEVGTGFHPELTGRENIYLHGALLGMARAEIRRCFDDIVDFSGIGTFLDTPVKRYSSGMYVRLAFSVAAHLPAEIMVIDEVLAVGDAEFQRRCLDRMQTFSKTGRTVLFVSHNLAAVRSLCTRGILLKAGRVTADGPADEVLDAYAREHSGASASTWLRHEKPSSALSFTRAEIGLADSSKLVCTVELHATEAFPPAFFAIDICDPAGVPLMQSIPRHDTFLHGATGSYRLQVTVDLPALIPGRYLIDLWAGPHFTETLDYVRQVAAFEVIDSPQAGRTYAHSSAHGFIAPPSVCVLEFEQPLAAA